jgi:5'-nucleotidase
MSRLAKENALSQTFMQANTEAIVERERRRSQRLEHPGKMHWKLAASLVIKSIRSKKHYQENLSVPQVEHMSEVDCFDGEKMRREWGASRAEAAEKEKSQDEKSSHPADEDDLLQIHPVLDGRFKDIGRA